MTNTDLSVDGKIAAYVPASLEMIEDGQAMQEAMQRWLNATPEQREQWQREAAERRAREREAASPVPLTVEALADAMGWSLAYAEHLVQPYCTCGPGDGGWDYCQHARDLGLNG